MRCPCKRYWEKNRHLRERQIRHARGSVSDFFFLIGDFNGEEIKLTLLLSSSTVCWVFFLVFFNPVEDI